MIREELQRLPTGPKELRKFGLVVGGVFLLLAAWFGWRDSPLAPYGAALGLPLMALGLAWPRGLRAVYLGWMALAFALGTVVSTVVLVAFFYLVVTPVGLLARLAGRDFLSQRLERGARSYWRPREGPPPKPEDYRRQF